MIRKRNMWLQLLLFIVTLGIYGIYWYYSTFKEMTEHEGNDDSAGLWTVLVLIPVIQWWAWWKHARLIEGTAQARLPHVVMFLLAVFLLPGYWLVSQIELNKVASNEPTATSPAQPA